MRHYRCFNQVENVSVVAIPNRPERVPDLLAEGVHALSEVPNNIDGVVIASNTNQHLADWQKFKKHFCLIEKPLFGEPTGELNQLVSESNGTAFTACVLRFNRVVQELKDLAGSRSKPDFVAVKCTSYLPDWRPDRDFRTMYSAQQGQGGALRELIHEIDYAGWIFGWPARVQGSLSTLKSIDIADEDSAKFLWESEQANIIFELDIANKTNSRMALVKYGDDSIIADIGQQSVMIQSGLSVNRIDFSEDRDAMYIRQAKAFVQAIKGNSPGALASAHDGLMALNVCQAVRLSHLSNEPTPL